MMLKSEQVMRVLLERLNWPVRFVRWQAAREFAALLSSSEWAVATRVFLEWLLSRQFEMEVVNGMAMLMCAPPGALPPADDVRSSVQKSSVLADILFQRLYGKPLGGWQKYHAGPAPIGYQAESYFEERMGQVVPEILAVDFRELEDESGHPFPQQWAFEWRTLMDTTNSPYSSFPHHFVNKGGSSTGIAGQLSQAQCNVYRSAFLRTLAHAVHRWGMPANHAAFVSLRCLPLSSDLLALHPMKRPSWLKNTPEKSCQPNVSLEAMARRLIKPNSGSKGMRPVSLRIPISNAVAEFGELAIEGFLATDDFSPPNDFSDDGARMLRWPMPDPISFSGELPDEHINKYRIEGVTGWCAPICLNLWPTSSGFWQNDYFHLGIASLAPYALNTQLDLGIVKGAIGFSCAGKRVGSWKVWHDNWSPIHVKDGHTRCGGLTEMKTTILDETAVRLGMKLAWHAKLSLWPRPSDYGAPTLLTQTAFFFERA